MNYLHYWYLHVDYLYFKLSVSRRLQWKDEFIIIIIFTLWIWNAWNENRKYVQHCRFWLVVTKRLTTPMVSSMLCRGIRSTGRSSVKAPSWGSAVQTNRTVVCSSKAWSRTAPLSMKYDSTTRGLRLKWVRVCFGYLLFHSIHIVPLIE